MSLIVAGRYETYPDAQRASARLFEAGFLEEDVTLFFVGPRGRHDKHPLGGDVGSDAGTRKAHKGAGIGTVFGAVVGAALGAAMFSLVNSPIPFMIGAAAVGAWVGSLLGAMVTTRRRRNEYGKDAPDEPQVRHSGVLVAVHVSEQTRPKAAAILEETGAREVERANGRWSRGEWVDFDPVTPPDRIDREGLREKAQANAAHSAVPKRS